MNLQNIVDEARLRDSAVVEICKALDELDAPALERILVYVVDKINMKQIALAAAVIGGGGAFLEEAKSDDSKKNTRKANATKKKKAEKKPIHDLITAALRSDEKGMTVEGIRNYTALSKSAIYTQLKKLGAYSNGKGRWWVDRKSYLVPAKRQGVNGAAAST